MIDEQELAAAINKAEIFELSFGEYIHLGTLRTILNDVSKPKALWTYHPKKRYKLRVEEI